MLTKPSDFSILRMVSAIDLCALSLIRSAVSSLYFLDPISAIFSLAFVMILSRSCMNLSWFSRLSSFMFVSFDAAACAFRSASLAAFRACSASFSSAAFACAAAACSAAACSACACSAASRLACSAFACSAAARSAFACPRASATCVAMVETFSARALIASVSWLMLLIFFAFSSALRALPSADRALIAASCASFTDTPALVATRCDSSASFKMEASSLFKSAKAACSWSCLALASARSACACACLL